MSDEVKRILIIGCGNIGSRHAQAVTKLPWNVSVECVEPNNSAIEITKQRIAEMPYDQDMINFRWFNSLKGTSNVSDLVIVSTTAIGRADLLKELLEQGHRTFIIEKLVCQSKIEYEAILTKFKDYNAKGWVNTTRRYYKSNQYIKKIFNKDQWIHYSVIAGNRGLGCNAIHYLDLFSWFINSENLELNGDFLLNSTFVNKRGDNLIEFAGTIIGSDESGSVATITFLPYDNLPDIINISGKEKHIVIDETNELSSILRGTIKPAFSYKNEFNSDVTKEIIQDIFTTNICILPTLKQSAALHYELFRIFNAHIKKLTGIEPELCPIT